MASHPYRFRRAFRLRCCPRIRIRGNFESAVCASPSPGLALSAPLRSVSGCICSVHFLWHSLGLPGVVLFLVAADARGIRWVLTFGAGEAYFFCCSGCMVSVLRRALRQRARSALALRYRLLDVALHSRHSRIRKQRLSGHLPIALYWLRCVQLVTAPVSRFSFPRRALWLHRFASCLC